MACRTVHEAVKGMGTDEKRLIAAMGSLSSDMKCKVPVRYEQLHGKDLKKVIKSEFRIGQKNLRNALSFLAVSPVEADCDILRHSCVGVGTNEEVLFCVLGGRSNKEIELLKKQYFTCYDKDLGRALDMELGGSFEKLVFNVLQGAEEDMDEGYHTDVLMKEDIETLYDAGTGKKFGTDESALFKILCARPAEYIKKLNTAYAEEHGYTLEKVLEKELSGHVEKAALFMIGMKLHPYETIASLIDRACKGFGTNDLLLICTLIRYQCVLKHVMLAHIEQFGSTIEDRIKSECRGDYENLLLELVKAAE